MLDSDFSRKHSVPSGASEKVTPKTEIAVSVILGEHTDAAGVDLRGNLASIKERAFCSLLDTLPSSQPIAVHFEHAHPAYLPGPYAPFSHLEAFLTRTEEFSKLGELKVLEDAVLNRFPNPEMRLQARDFFQRLSSDEQDRFTKMKGILPLDSSPADLKPILLRLTQEPDCREIQVSLESAPFESWLEALAGIMKGEVSWRLRMIGDLEGAVEASVQRFKAYRLANILRDRTLLATIKEFESRPSNYAHIIFRGQMHKTTLEQAAEEHGVGLNFSSSEDYISVMQHPGIRACTNLDSTDEELAVLAIRMSIAYDISSALNFNANTSSDFLVWVNNIPKEELMVWLNSLNGCKSDDWFEHCKHGLAMAYESLNGFEQLVRQL